MSFEDDINNLNEFFFFKEFTYSKNKFKRADGQEVEVADSIVYLDDVSFVFQVKERDIQTNSSSENEEKWFKNKVIKLATRQIRDTVSYINNYQGVTLANNRGHSTDVSTASLASLHKIVIHESSEVLPNKLANIKFHISETAGVIHILQAHDYLGVVHYLLTPTELAEYFRFRAILIDKYGQNINHISEKALLGQYFSGDEVSDPSEDFISYIIKLRKNTESWDMTSIIKLFPNRMVGEEGPTDYYCIVKEIAKLMRNELFLFKERFMLSWEAAKENKSVMPYRFLVPRTGCSFLFLPLLEKEKENRRDFLINLTRVNKYDLRSSKAIGVSFLSSEGNWQDIEWYFIELPWEKNTETDKLLSENFPFRKVDEKIIDRYEFQ